MSDKKIKAVLMMASHFSYPNKVLTVIEDYGCVFKIEYYSKYLNDFVEDTVSRQHVVEFIH